MAPLSPEVQCPIFNQFALLSPLRFEWCRFTLFNPGINSDQQTRTERGLEEFEMDTLIEFNTVRLDCSQNCRFVQWCGHQAGRQQWWFEVNVWVNWTWPQVTSRSSSNVTVIFVSNPSGPHALRFSISKGIVFENFPVMRIIVIEKSGKGSYLGCFWFQFDLLRVWRHKFWQTLWNTGL